MVDRVYMAGIPELRKELEKLEKEFSKLGPRVDWVGARVAPVLKHAAALEKLLSSKSFSQDFSRLTKGVELFHSDLVYLRSNVKGLTRVLDSERRLRGRKRD